jgi:hypothetical protein
MSTKTKWIVAAVAAVVILGGLYKCGYTPSAQQQESKTRGSN